MISLAFLSKTSVFVADQNFNGYRTPTVSMAYGYVVDGGMELASPGYFGLMMLGFDTEACAAFLKSN